MIKSYIQGKRVSWNVLEKIKLGKTVHYIRKMKFGIVKDVSTCNGLCLVLEDDTNERHELEIAEVDTLD